MQKVIFQVIINSMDKTVLLLGYGYVASFLKRKLEKSGYKVLSTSRSGAPHILFSLDDAKTWHNIVSVDYTIWTFPAEPFDEVQRFFKQSNKKLGKLILIGSTSVFKSTTADEWVKETTPIDESVSRVRGENYLIKNGARIVYSSGIYGPSRNPINWVKHSYVGKSKKYVNMIHVDDLCQFLMNTIVYGKSGARYIASDNNPKRWVEVIDLWEKAGLLANTPNKDSARVSKRVDSSKSIVDLKINLKYSDFSDAVLQGLLSE